MLMWSLALSAKFNPAPKQLSKPWAHSHPPSFPRAPPGLSTPSFPHTPPSIQRILGPLPARPHGQGPECA